jgi:hypothetical protein
MSAQGGQQPASQSATRVFEVPTVGQLEDGSLVIDLSEAETWAHRMLGVLQEIGGTLTITAERQRAGERGGQPLGLTTGIVARWTAFAPFVDPAPEPEPGAGEGAE